MHSFREPINYSEDGGVTVRRGKTSDEIQRDVRPWACWSGYQAEKTHRWSVDCVSLGTDRAGSHKLPDIWVHGTPPPETPLEERQNLSYPRMTRPPGGVGPLEHSGTDLQLGGPLPGSGSNLRASLMSCSTSEVTA